MRIARVSPLAPIAGALALVLAGKLLVLDVRVVEGVSMAPTLSPGQLVLVWRAAYGIRVPGVNRYILRWRAPRPPELLVVRSPVEQRWLVKRCVASTEAGVTVRGDNAEQSVDSRHFGSVAIDWVAGRAMPLQLRVAVRGTTQ
jgi:signal peptidase I